MTRGSFDTTCYRAASIEKWYKNVEFQLQHVTISEYLVNWYWMCIEYGQGVWFIGQEMLRNIVSIVWGSEGPKPIGSLENQISGLASMPDLVHDDQFAENVNETTSDHRIQPLDESRNSREEKRAPNPIQLVNQSSKAIRIAREELEPAFIREKNYPSGWLVFHSRLGVVQRDVADEYERKRHCLAAKPIKSNVMITLSPHVSAVPCRR